MAAHLEARFVPWRGFEEWQRVMDAFFSTDADAESISTGILMVRSWMERGRVPTAIESTLNLFQLLLHDPDYMHLFLNGNGNESDSERNVSAKDGFEDGSDSGSDSDSDSEEDISSLKDSSSSVAGRILQHGYNSAIIRFVNELVDQAQKGLYATSITRLADQLGLPRFFVDLRHDGTHDSLPSLELLRWAAGEALRWLKAHYWEPEAKFKEWLHFHLPAKIKTLLAEYTDELARFQELPGLAVLVKSSMSRVLSSVDALFTSSRCMRVFLSVLATDGIGKNSELILESLVRALAKGAPKLFLVELAKMNLAGPGYRREWFQWGVEEAVTVDPAEATEGLASAAFKEASTSRLAFQRLRDDLWPMFTANESVPATLLIRWSPRLEALQRPLQSGSSSSSAGQAVSNPGYDACLERSQRLLRLVSRTPSAIRETPAAAATDSHPLGKDDWREDVSWRPR